MYQGLATGWADLVLPATSYLERDGTVVNLEGRPAAAAPRGRAARFPTSSPGSPSWPRRFGVELSPHASVVFDELAPRHLPRPRYGSAARARCHCRRAPRTRRRPAGAEPRAPVERTVGEHFVGELRLLRYRPLFSGPHVERVPELAFQRPEPELALSPADAERRSIASGDTVLVRSNGTSVELRARIDRRLAAGVARVAEEHAGDLHQLVEVLRA